jgi:hypothetical protein
MSSKVTECRKRKALKYAERYGVSLEAARVIVDLTSDIANRYARAGCSHDEAWNYAIAEMAVVSVKHDKK